VRSSRLMFDEFRASPSTRHSERSEESLFDRQRIEIAQVDRPRPVRTPQVSRHNHKILAIILALALLASAVAAKKSLPVKPINLNTATTEQLQQLPGIGPATAKKIIEMREKSGPFRRVEDLLAVRGISDKHLAKLRPYVTVAMPDPKKK
jgi:competence ComEA-like helix-hairpin-helix protein